MRYLVNISLLFTTVLVTSSFFIVGVISPTKIAFLIFFSLFFLLIITLKRITIGFTYFDFVTVLILFLAIFSQLYSRDFSESFKILLSYFQYVVFYFVARVLFSNRADLLPKIQRYLIVALLVSCFFGLIQFLTGYGYMPGTPDRSMFTNGVRRACGMFDDPNYFGFVLSVIWPLGLFIKNKALKNIILLVFFVTIFLTLSRATLLILILQMVFFLYFKSKYKITFLLRFFGAILFASLVLFITQPAFLFDRIDTLLPLFTGETNKLENSSAERLDLLFAGIKMFIDNFWFGVGFGNFQLYSAEYMTFFPRSVYAHNTYLTIAAELGVFGLLVWGSGLLYLYLVMSRRSFIYCLSIIGVLFSYFFLVANYFQFMAFYFAYLVSCHQKLGRSF